VIERSPGNIPLPGRSGGNLLFVVGGAAGWRKKKDSKRTSTGEKKNGAERSPKRCGIRGNETKNSKDTWD